MFVILLVVVIIAIVLFFRILLMMVREIREISKGLAGIKAEIIELKQEIKRCAGSQK